MARKKNVEVSKLEAAPVETVVDAGMLFSTAPIQPATTPAHTAEAPVNSETPAPSTGSMFSLENLAMAEEMIAVPPPMDAPIEIAKPPKDKFIRVCPLPNYSAAYYAIKYNGDFFPVLPALARNLLADPTLGPTVSRVRFSLCATLNGPYFVWITQIIEGTKKPSSVAMGQEAALEAGRLQWVRVQWSAEKNVHEYCKMLVEQSAPEWPTRPFPEILEAAVGAHRMIMTADHEVLQKLAGKRV
jgi:hypothetical protein